MLRKTGQGIERWISFLDRNRRRILIGMVLLTGVTAYFYSHVPDNYPKMVVSMDETPGRGTYKGIRHVNVRDLLTGRGGV